LMNIFKNIGAKRMITVKNESSRQNPH